MSELYQVEKFKDYRPKDKENQWISDLEVKVKWEGYDKPEDDSWEPLVNMYDDDGTTNYVMEYFASMRLKPVRKGERQVKLIRLTDEDEG